MKDSIFRKEKIERTKNFEEKFSKKVFYKNYRTHDNGVARARLYTLTTEILFTEYSGLTIKQLIEKDLDYFLWLPLNIENFIYNRDVLDYAEECIKFLDNLENPDLPLTSELSYLKQQVGLMIKYEDYLGLDDTTSLGLGYKAQINQKFYKTIFNTTKEKLVRQYFNKNFYSKEYRRNYFIEIVSKFK